MKNKLSRRDLFAAVGGLFAGVACADILLADEDTAENIVFRGTGTWSPNSFKQQMHEAFDRQLYFPAYSDPRLTMRTDYWNLDPRGTREWAWYEEQAR